MLRASIELVDKATCSGWDTGYNFNEIKKYMVMEMMMLLRLW